MSDFKTTQDFRKGNLRKYPYQDPTYLSFVLLFDFTSHEVSPLLSGPAEEFIEKLAAGGAEDRFYKDRLADLKAFIRALREINTEMPWYWQSLSGFSKIQQYDPTKPYIGGDDAILEIETLESLNLPIAGLMHLYRRAIFDERKWSYILPKNLRKFKMMVYVTEVRKIASGPLPPSRTAKDIGAQQIMGQSGRPFFAAFLKYCEFDMTRGTAAFDTLSRSPDGPAANNIAIKYEALEKIEARVLNGMITELPVIERMGGYLSPALDTETYGPDSSNGGEAQGEIGQKNVYNEDGAIFRAGGRLDKFKQQASSDLRRLGKEKKIELVDKARQMTINRLPSFESVYMGAINAIDGVTNIPGVNGGDTTSVGFDRVSADVAASIQSNIHGNILGRTPAEMLAEAASAALDLGNVYE